MPKTLTLMEEADLPAVEIAIAKALPGRSITIDWWHEERLTLTLETDIPAADVGEIYRKAVIPLLADLEKKFGEFEFELRTLCACGCWCWPMISDNNPEHDTCLCGKCLDRSIDEHRDGSRNTCPVCKKGFDGFKNPGWRVNCSAKFRSGVGGAKPEMDIETIRIGGATAGTDISRWDCCSRECALKQFQQWLSEVESHPVAKEVRP